MLYQSKLKTCCCSAGTSAGETKPVPGRSVSSRTTMLVSGGDRFAGTNTLWAQADPPSHAV